ncbi:MAG: hypothetical protein RBT51_08215, partial [Ectothiorhodospiraceae bacterium]|nr:hypothetical protein [Ectothiorhodospiraceae bacterium]
MIDLGNDVPAGARDRSPYGQYWNTAIIDAVHPARRLVAYRHGGRESRIGSGYLEWSAVRAMTQMVEESHFV